MVSTDGSICQGTSSMPLRVDGLEEGRCRRGCRRNRADIRGVRPWWRWDRIPTARSTHEGGGAERMREEGRPQRAGMAATGERGRGASSTAIRCVRSA